MADLIPPTSAALREALSLSEEILRNIELSEQPLSNIALKAGRLARLLNDFESQTIMTYEAGGYPTGNGGLSQEIYSLAARAGREFDQKDEAGNTSKLVYITPISELEQMVEIAGTEIDAARDRNISISSSNPYQSVSTPSTNIKERNQIRQRTAESVRRLAQRRAFIHTYALRKHTELKYSGIADDIFSRLREKVDGRIGVHVPDAVQKLTAVYENLLSDNREDWSNAVHSCRRILQDLADSIYPPRDDLQKDIGNGKTKTIKLGPDNYINRIVAFIENKSKSGRFQAIVGSHLSFIGERLDAVFEAAQKGSHATVDKEEADRYVVYTYLVVGDVLSLI